MTEQTQVAKEFHMLRIFPEQVHTFWGPIREAVIDSFGSVYGQIDEDEIASIQSEIMRGAIQVFGIVESTEDLALTAIALTIISNEPVLRKKSLVIVGIKSFRHIPDGVWSKLLVGAVNQARAEGCTAISLVSKDERIIKICKDNEFSIDTRFCFLEIGV